MKRKPSYHHMIISALVLALVCTVAMPGRASERRFHAHLVRSAPAQYDTLRSSPVKVQLWFSEPVEQSLTRIELTNSAGARIALGAVSSRASDGAVVSADYAGVPMPAGDYRVAWRTMARDGHPSKGQYAFVIRGPMTK